jgi:cytochrome c553
MLTTLALAVQTNELDAALKRQPDHERGRALYETCAACHQTDGGGVADGDIPSIAGQHYPVVLKQLVDFRDTERIEPRMNAFAARHHLEGAQDLADVAAYVSSLPVQPTTAHGPGKYAGFGRQAYERACQSCHGKTAAGDQKAGVPRLAGQHYGYLVKQIEMMIAGERRNVNVDHPKLLDTLTGEEISGVADFLARLDPVAGP